MLWSDGASYCHIVNFVFDYGENGGSPFVSLITFIVAWKLYCNIYGLVSKIQFLQMWNMYIFWVFHTKKYEIFWKYFKVQNIWQNISWKTINFTLLCCSWSKQIVVLLTISDRGIFLFLCADLLQLTDVWPQFIENIFRQQIP